MSLSVQETRRRFDEYATLEYLLTGDLRAALDEVTDAESQRWLAGVVSSLVESLPQKLELTLEFDQAFVSAGLISSEPAVFGYLHSEQRQLLAALEEIHQILREASAPADGTCVAARPLIEWLEHLSEHNRTFADAARPLLQPATPRPRRKRSGK